ncbi:MAG: hypothetical protein HXS54_10655 [Theionarchaea archaeon]|nr:hypothetical protein [Theionarchaea archaeon]
MEEISYTRERPLYYMEEFLSQKIHDVRKSMMLDLQGLSSVHLDWEKLLSWPVQQRELLRRKRKSATYRMNWPSLSFWTPCS